MINLVIELALSLLLFGVTSLVMLGWGCALMRLLKIRLPGAEGFFSRLWLGWAVLLFFLQLANFVMPVNWIVTSVLAIGGLLAVWLCRGDIVRFSLNTRITTYLLILLLSACWLITHAMQATDLYDSGLYHFQSIRWYNEYAIVPGLGNVHGRLAFNQSFFAFAAALNLHPFFQHGQVLANCFLLWLLAAEGWHALIFRRGEDSLARFATITTLPLILFIVLRVNPSAPTPDISTIFLQLLTWIYFVRYMQEEVPQETDNARIHVICILSATAVTVKLSSLFFVAFIVLIILVREWLVKRPPFGLYLRSLLQFLWLPLVIILMWMGRGYILSGYPLYPSTIAGIQVDWALPAEKAEEEARAIYLWARYESTEEPEDPWSWVVPWLLNAASSGWRTVLAYPIAVTVMTLAAYGLLTLLMRLKWISRPNPPQDAMQNKGQLSTLTTTYGILMLPIVLAIIIWWLSAPDPRFARAILWLLPVATTYMLIQRLEELRWGWSRLNQVIAFVLISGAVLATFAVYWPQAVRVPPGFMPLPSPPLVLHTIDTLRIWEPAGEGYELCWNSELPCTPDVDDSLRLRGATLQEGFSVLPQ